MVLRHLHPPSSRDIITTSVHHDRHWCLLVRGRSTNTYLIVLQTMTHLRLIVNVLVGFMLGSLFINAGNEGSRVLENYNLLFAILMHHMMSPMMLTILTCKLHICCLSFRVFFLIYLFGTCTYNRLGYNKHASPL